jgi:hypothetical protein
VAGGRGRSWVGGRGWSWGGGSRGIVVFHGAGGWSRRGGRVAAPRPAAGRRVALPLDNAVVSNVTVNVVRLDRERVCGSSVKGGREDSQGAQSEQKLDRSHL